MRLIPPHIKKELGWTPYLWLAYLGFFYVPLTQHHTSVAMWALSNVAVVFFLALYFGAYWVEGVWLLGVLAGMAALGFGFAPFNAGSAVFVIYTAANIPYYRETRSAIKLMALLLCFIGLETWWLQLPRDFWIPAVIFSLLASAINIHFAQRMRARRKLQMAQEEIEHLAKVAERERIARDLHDVLGHTLSVIILKSELVGKLIDRDPERAKSEIADVEQTSRAALAEVRNTIRGYRANTLEAELKQAKAALETAGVMVNSEVVEAGLSPTQETVVALILKEAVTNIVRHAQAKNCRVRMSPANGNCLLEIHDDGRGGMQAEGSGILGMRERIEALGGTFQRNTSAGTKLTIQFPLATASGNGTH